MLISENQFSICVLKNLSAIKNRQSLTLKILHIRIEKRPLSTFHCTQRSFIMQIKEVFKTSISYIISTLLFTKAVKSLPVNNPCAKRAKSNACLANFSFSSADSVLRILSTNGWLPLTATL